MHNKWPVERRYLELGYFKYFPASKTEKTKLKLLNELSKSGQLFRFVTPTRKT